MLRRMIQATLVGYVVLGLVTRGLEEFGLYARCERDPACWCKRPGLTVFRWVFPRGHTGPWNRTEVTEPNQPPA
jgi:hypothetical protein